MDTFLPSEKLIYIEGDVHKVAQRQMVAGPDLSPCLLTLPGSDHIPPSGCAHSNRKPLEDTHTVTLAHRQGNGTNI